MRSQLYFFFSFFKYNLTPSGETDSDSTHEDGQLVVPKIPLGISGTALAASLLRDGWSVRFVTSSYMFDYHSLISYANVFLPPYTICVDLFLLSVAC